MNRTIATLLIIVSLMGISYAAIRFWQHWEADRALNALTDVMQSPDLGALFDPDNEDIRGSVDQAMRGVNLVEGTEGYELWRLQATWATFSEETGNVEMESPVISYTVKTPDEEGDYDYVHASARRGRIEENNTLLSMEGNVFASYEVQSLEGPYAVFRNDIRVLEFPDGGFFSSPDLEGEGDVLRWDMNTNIIEGKGRVSVTWTPGQGERNTRVQEAAPTDTAEERDVPNL